MFVSECNTGKNLKVDIFKIMPFGIEINTQKGNYKLLLCQINKIMMIFFWKFGPKLENALFLLALSNFYKISTISLSMLTFMSKDDNESWG